MSVKPLFLLALCLSLSLVLFLHYRAGKRRLVLASLIFCFVWLGLSPFLYKLMPGIFPRVTIGWPLLCMLTGLVWYFTPAIGRPVTMVDDDDFDSSIPTGPAPLEPQQPTVH